jgi:hypothetical protein
MVLYCTFSSKCRAKDVTAELGVAGIAAQDVVGVIEVGFRFAPGDPACGSNDDWRLNCDNQIEDLSAYAMEHYLDGFVVEGRHSRTSALHIKPFS